MDPFDDVLKAPAIRQMYMVVRALPTVMLMLTFVLWFMKNEGSEASGFAPVQVALFAVIAAASLPAALWVRRISLRQDVEKIAARYSQSGITITREGAVLQTISTSSVVGMAMPEVSVLLGFVAGFMTMNWASYIPFALYPLIGWAIMYPRPSQVREWYARQMEPASLPPMNT